MKPPIEGWKAITTVEIISIPRSDGSGIAEQRDVEVPAWQDPATKEIYFDSRAEEIMDAVRARLLGILLPEQLKELRKKFGLTQTQMSQRLQMGQKTWTRWETGKERPSRSINLLLCALFEGEITMDFLETCASPLHRKARCQWPLPVSTGKNQCVTYFNKPAHHHETEDIPA